MKEKIKTKDFIHNKNSKILDNLREIVFGIEDGMVSTLGALTGIAVATNDHFTVIISGLVIISVESISMGVGSYLSSRSIKEIESRKLAEESIQLKKSPKREKAELFEIFRKDGWPSSLALKMSEAASKNHALMLKEMAYRELAIIPNNLKSNFLNGLAMFVCYIIGGLIPLAPYFVLPVSTALPLSIILAMFGLFLLGSLTAKLGVTKWWKNGLRILILGMISMTIGFLVGQLASYIQ